MQKNKRIILTCLKGLKAGEVCDHFKLRKYTQQNSNPTNSAELIRNLGILERKGCVTEDKGNYRIAKKGVELLDLLNRVVKILR